MAEQREVTIHLDATDLTRIKGVAGSEEFYRAIGYLSAWNLTFPKVDIYNDGEADLVASYKNEDGSHGYTIGAVFGTHNGKYGFHS